MDNELAERAHLLGTSVPGPLQNEWVAGVDEQYAFQVFNAAQLLWRSDNAPTTPITTVFGFQDINFSQHRWRSYAVRNDAGLLVIAAQRIDIRNSLAEDIIVESVMPVVIALPLMGMLIWLVVGYGLSPLRNLAEHLRERQSDDLRTIPTGQQPVELLQVVNSTNGLLQRLEASFDRERRFASDAAHELRTPIASLKVHLHNIAHVLPEDEPELVNLVSATNRMGNLVEQILALYRTSPDHYMADFTRLDLHWLVKNLISSLYPQFLHSDINLELKGSMAFMSGDKMALETMLKNLLDNACKYTPAGGEVRVSVSRKPDGGVELRVEDSGPGVPEHQYQRIFERFYRLGGDYHRSGVIGCGLGLSIVQHIADLHSASIKPGPSCFETGLAVTVHFPDLDKDKSDSA